MKKLQSLSVRAVLLVLFYTSTHLISPGRCSCSLCIHIFLPSNHEIEVIADLHYSQPYAALVFVRGYNMTTEKKHGLVKVQLRTPRLYSVPTL